MGFTVKVECANPYVDLLGAGIFGCPGKKSVKGLFIDSPEYGYLFWSSAVT